MYLLQRPANGKSVPIRSRQNYCQTANYSGQPSRLQRVLLFRAVPWRLLGKRLSNYRNNRIARSALPQGREYEWETRKDYKFSALLIRRRSSPKFFLLEFCLAKIYINLRIIFEIAGKFIQRKTCSGHPFKKIEPLVLRRTSSTRSTSPSLSIRAS